MNRIAADRAVFQSSLGVSSSQKWQGETQTPSGESRAHFPSSQSKVGNYRGQDALSGKETGVVLGEFPEENGRSVLAE